MALRMASARLRDARKREHVAEYAYEHVAEYGNTGMLMNTNMFMIMIWRCLGYDVVVIVYGFVTIL